MNPAPSGLADRIHRHLTNSHGTTPDNIPLLTALIVAAKSEPVDLRRWLRLDPQHRSHLARAFYALRDHNFRSLFHHLRHTFPTA